MNTVGKGSFVIKQCGNEFDVYSELLNTSKVPYELSADAHWTEDHIIYYDDVALLIKNFIQSGGYAGLSLAEYLDSFYPVVI